jgi:hypothetical protein
VIIIVSRNFGSKNSYVLKCLNMMFRPLVSGTSEADIVRVVDVTHRTPKQKPTIFDYELLQTPFTCKRMSRGMFSGLHKFWWSSYRFISQAKQIMKERMAKSDIKKLLSNSFLLSNLFIFKYSTNLY